jgi:hypothetical protein
MSDWFTGFDAEGKIATAFRITDIIGIAKAVDGKTYIFLRGVTNPIETLDSMDHLASLLGIKYLRKPTCT